ncbi:hypothetical protein A9Q84_06605 [Halobacteriovorax marinus]|uniref:Phosphatidate phosphatase APP1 catalytic domain-containing protein n=1 Tax=Halobacteriovorax marinus TaxID=97084 RepID=A0A1Y5FFC7_9BACT|nr:hypothetical protein A9Q84_06605 [Halobacteriovorax marinus]
MSFSLNAKVMMISDIDDTIKRSHILGYMTGGVRTTNPFIGMPELYMAFQCHAEETKISKKFCLSKRGMVHSNKRWVSYVTGAVGRLQLFGREFISRSKFPTGTVAGRTANLSTLNFKAKEISEIISTQDFDFILIGDNGQHDVAAYKKVTDRFSSKNIVTFIHQLYSVYEEDKAKRGVKLAKGQIAYLTASDLALEFYARGWIDYEDVLKVSKKVFSYINSRDDDIYEKVIPSWTKCAAFVKSYKRPSVSIDSQLDDTLKRIEKRLNSLCRGRW